MSSNNYPEPGSEINTIQRNVSPAGLQARAAATQTVAPVGTTLSDPVQVSGTPQQASETAFNTVATDHDPTLNFSSPGLQARAAAAGQAPVGTVQPEYLSSSSVNETPYTESSPMGTAPDTIEFSQQTQQNYIPTSEEPVQYTPIDSLNTAREVFQPTSANQPQGEFNHQQASPQAATFSSPYQSYAGQDAQRAATQLPNAAPSGTQYSNFAPSQPYAGSSPAVPADSAFSGYQSSAGALARNAATQTSSSAPTGTVFSQPADGAARPSFYPGAQNFQQAEPASSTQNSTPSHSASTYTGHTGSNSGAGAAARAAAAGQHPSGTGPTAGIASQLAGNPASYGGRADASNAFAAPPAQARGLPAADAGMSDSPGLQARAAVQGFHPPGTGPGSVKGVRSYSIASDAAPGASDSPGLQARAAAQGRHPPGTGPGSVRGVRTFSTMNRVAPTVLRTMRLLRR